MTNGTQKTALFLTYNTVGKSGSYGGMVERNGHQAVIVQHPKGETWGGCGRANEKNPGSKCAGLVHTLYGSALRHEDVDYVVVYVGDRGSEGAVHMVSDLPANKVLFVLCNCNLGYKLGLIQNSLPGAPYRVCECGGHATMQKVLEEFLDTGSLGKADEKEQVLSVLRYLVQ